MSLSEEVSSAELLQAHTVLLKALLSHIKTMALKCAIDLGIPEIIHKHGGSIALSKLIDALPIHPSKAHCIPRLMRILVHFGFFGTKENDQLQQEQLEEEYSLNVASRLLLDEGPLVTMKSMVALQFLPNVVSRWVSWSNWFCKSDATMFETAGGSTLYDCGGNVKPRHIFDEAMSNDSKLIAHIALKDCKEVFEGLKSLVDVGGGTGTMAKAITKSFPHINCTVFDLPHVVAGLQGSEQLNFVGGNMFSDPIPPADAILLKWILHNWNDEECLSILKKCREAVLRNGKEGKVIIIDIVIDSRNLDKEVIETQLYFDIIMMVISGKERSLTEWDSLFKNAGFSHYKITPTLGERSFIEVYP